MRSGYMYVPVGEAEIELGVSGALSVSHRKPGGAIHGHTYRITAWFDAGDLDELKAKLAGQLAPLDHTILDDEYGRAEDLGRFLLTRLHGCYKIQVDRPIEGQFCNVFSRRRTPSA